MSNMFLGVVWRTFEPGTKLDEIPILVVGPGRHQVKAPSPQWLFRKIYTRGLYGSGLDLSSTPQRMVQKASWGGASSRYRRNGGFRRW